MNIKTNFLEKTPVKALLSSDEGVFKMEGTDCYTHGDVTARLIRENEVTRIEINALNTGVKGITFHWKADLPVSVKVLGDHWERGYGDLEWRGLNPERALPWFFLIDSGDAIAGAGVKTGANAICHWRISRDYISLHVDTRNGAEGVLLKGRTLHAATMLAWETPKDNAFEPARTFCSYLCDKPLMPAQPLYGGNNWYYAYGISSHEKILKDSEFISSLSESAENRPFMFIDDGWQAQRAAGYTGGPWDKGNKSFPDMQRLAEEMKKNGVRPGLWIRPLLTLADVPDSYKLNPVRFKSLNDCCSGLDAFLDPSIPEVLEMVRTDITRISGWGYEMIKHDFTTYDIFGHWGFDMNDSFTNDGWHLHDRTKTTAEIIKNLYATIKNAAGKSAILGCNTIGHLAAGMVEAQRTGDDTSGIEWSRTRKMGINTMAFRIAQHGTFFAADADCVGITEYIPWELNSQWLELVAKSGTPLFVSADPKKVTAEQRKAVKRAFDIASKPMPLAMPLDWQYTPCPTEFELGGEKRRFNWGE